MYYITVGKNGAYSASVSFNPMTSFVPATGTYEFLINVTNRASGESASHIFTMNVVLPTTTTGKRITVFFS